MCLWVFWQAHLSPRASSHLTLESEAGEVGCWPLGGPRNLSHGAIRLESIRVECGYVKGQGSSLRDPEGEK